MSSLPQRASICFAFFVCFLVPPAALGQFAPEELSRDDALASFLESAKVVKSKQLPETAGITRPYRLTLEDASGQRLEACFKSVHGQLYGYWEGWQYEIAAYRLDRHLGMGMVPPTVERRFEGELGSCQLWIEGMDNGLEVQESGRAIPGEYTQNWYRALALQEAFDNLIGNQDRIMRNLLVTPEFKLILIDHSRTFRRSRRSQKKLPFDMPSAMKTPPSPSSTSSGHWTGARWKR